MQWRTNITSPLPCIRPPKGSKAEMFLPNTVTTISMISLPQTEVRDPIKEIQAWEVEALEISTLKNRNISLNAEMSLRDLSAAPTEVDPSLITVIRRLPGQLWEEIWQQVETSSKRATAGQRQTMITIKMRLLTRLSLRSRTNKVVLGQILVLMLSRAPKTCSCTNARAVAETSIPRLLINMRKFVTRFSSRRGRNSIVKPTESSQMNTSKY